MLSPLLKNVIFNSSSKFRLSDWKDFITLRAHISVIFALCLSLSRARACVRLLRAHVLGERSCWRTVAPGGAAGSQTGAEPRTERQAPGQREASWTAAAVCEAGRTLTRMNQ